MDLIVNPEVKRNFICAAQFIEHVRTSWTAGDIWRWRPGPEHHLRRRHCPSLHHPPQHPGHRHVHAHRHRTALKRLIVGGLDRVYEDRSHFSAMRAWTQHNPEFTTVELYQAYADFNDMMDLFEDLLSSAAKKILGTYQVWSGRGEIDLTPGWPRGPCVRR